MNSVFIMLFFMTLDAVYAAFTSARIFPKAMNDTQSLMGLG